MVAEIIERHKVCPLLLRCFWRHGVHHRPEQFQLDEALPTNDELQIYTWQDASLREIATLVQGVNDLARRRNARLEFSIVYPDRTGKMVMREVGVVHSTRAGPPDQSTLRDLKFQTGDYLDIAIFA
jgi:histone deacetylase complex subunit SAP18|eukprot:12932-Heterococcus_DN1.PRE.2